MYAHTHKAKRRKINFLIGNRCYSISLVISSTRLLLGSQHHLFALVQTLPRRNMFAFPRTHHFNKLTTLLPSFIPATKQNDTLHHFPHCFFVYYSFRFSILLSEFSISCCDFSHQIYGDTHAQTQRNNHVLTQLKITTAQHLYWDLNA